MMFEEYYDYTENLLVKQHEVSAIITHPVIKGEVREHFLKEVIEKIFPDDIKFYRGFISYDITDQNQIDLFVKRKAAMTMNFGNHVGIHPDDCVFMIEVKSTATGTDIKDFNERSRKLKHQCADKQPLCGMFCYKVDLKKTTTLERFGYSYNEDAEMYVTDEDLELQYPYIDFFVCIDQTPFTEDHTGTNEMFLRKDSSLLSDGSYDLSENLPAIKDFLAMIKAILKNESQPTNVHTFASPSSQNTVQSLQKSAHFSLLKRISKFFSYALKRKK
ncbi:MAG: hypothetical protein RBT49_13345 [Bacteroidales bacterium]|jgi:hypothetical protein|nr:hypothetical protein [Bacteroidales bacterium]